MKIIDPGHDYELDSLDGPFPQRLVFVKREGAKYPENVGSHPGTTMQEVLRALIDRAEYVNNQIPCAETEAAIGLMKSAILLFELRAATRHGRHLQLDSLDAILACEKCVTCGHIGCREHAS